LVKVLGKGMPERLFSGVGAPVDTQMKEVDKRYGELKGLLDQAANKRKTLEEILLPLAGTWGARDDMRRQIMTTDAEKLDGLLEAAFREARREDLQLEQRRRAIAHLLLNAVKPAEKPEDAAAERQRVVVVVGLSSYTSEIEYQAGALAAMLPQLQQDIADERAAFALQHQALLQQIIALAERVKGAIDTLNKQNAVKTQHDVLLAKRQEEVKEVEERIKAAIKAKTEALAKQSQLEQELFDTNRTIRQASETNQKLESDIKNLEQGGPGGKP